MRMNESLTNIRAMMSATWFYLSAAAIVLLSPRPARRL